VPRRVACRRCGLPSSTSLCSRCNGETYGSAEYRKNSAIIRVKSKRFIVSGFTVLCVICFKPIVQASEVTIEHIVSVGNGGSNRLDNLGPAHAKCNYSQRPAHH